MTQAGGQKQMSEDQGGDGERVVLRAEKPRPQTKMSQQQKELLVWIYREQYRATNGPLSSVHRMVESTQAHYEWATYHLMKSLNSAVGGPLPPKPRTKRYQGIPWNAERYLGRKPVKTKQKQESMELSRRLDSLEKRKLIKRNRSGRYTTRVWLTSQGEQLAIILLEQGH